MGVLDEGGLERVWARMKEYVAKNGGVASTVDKLSTARAIDGVLFDGSESRHHYGTCSTLGSSATKTCTVAGFSLVQGARVIVRFSNTNTAENPMLNVSGTGAKPICYRSSAVPAGYIMAGAVLEMVYHEGNWYIVGDLAKYLIDPILSPVALYTSTTGIYASSTAAWKYTTVSGLSNWKEVRMYIEAGDGERGYRTFTRGKTNCIVSGFVNANFNGCMEISCDFASNRVGVYTKHMTGWALSNLRVLTVEGLVRN